MTPNALFYLDSVLTLYRQGKSATVGLYFKLHCAWSPEDGNLKGIADKVWTLKTKILTLKDEIWTLNVLKNLFLKINTARRQKPWIHRSPHFVRTEFKEARFMKLECDFAGK